jgi:hypothetical protein
LKDATKQNFSRVVSAANLRGGINVRLVRENWVGDCVKFIPSFTISSTALE